MIDYTSIFTQIAEAVDKIANTPDYTWWAAPFAIIFSCFIGWKAATRTIKEQKSQETEKNESKKQMVFHVLHDEISLRWFGEEEIQPYLQKLLKADKWEALEKFGIMVLSQNDLFVFKSISNSFSDYFFIKDNQLVSQIIHGYLVVQDFLDFKSAVKQHFEKVNATKEKLNKQGLSEESIKQHLENSYGKRTNHLWELFKKKLNAIDSRFLEIFLKVSKIIISKKKKEGNDQETRVFIDHSLKVLPKKNNTHFQELSLKKTMSVLENNTIFKTQITLMVADLLYQKSQFIRDEKKLYKCCLLQALLLYKKAMSDSKVPFSSKTTQKISQIEKKLTSSDLKNITQILNKHS